MNVSLLSIFFIAEKWVLKSPADVPQDSVVQPSNEPLGF